MIFVNPDACFSDTTSPQQFITRMVIILLSNAVKSNSLSPPTQKNTSVRGKVTQNAWQCKTCGSCTRPLPDEELQQAVTTILHEITRHPERLTPPKRRENVEMGIIRLKRELQQLMEHDRTSTDQLLEMSKTLAEKRYASCGNPQISQTRNAKNLLESSQSQGTDTDDLLRWIVKNILLRADGAVQLRLINDQIIE